MRFDHDFPACTPFRANGKSSSNRKNEAPPPSRPRPLPPGSASAREEAQGGRFEMQRPKRKEKCEFMQILFCLELNNGLAESYIMNCVTKAIIYFILQTFDRYLFF